MRAPVPKNEAARIAALREHKILDSAPERSFDDIVQLARIICDMPIALVTMVDEERQWFKARIGLDFPETPRDSSFCAHALASRDALVVPDAHADGRFADNELVTADPQIRFYAGVPIYVDGVDAAVGTLCVLDRVPRTLTPAQMGALGALARRVETEMRLRKLANTTRREGAAKTGVRLRPVEDATLAEGDVVGARYRVEDLIGAGGMGRVYRAVDTVSGDRVAIKVMGAMSVSDDEAVERFAREARALLRVASPHVARFVDAGNLASGAPYIIIEHLEGHDLSHADARSPSVGEAIALALQACDGVGAAHDAGVIHRDLKPGNLFLARASDGSITLKVLDFGIAKLVHADSPSSAGAQLTQVGGILGSPRYMSPEQLLSSRDVDASADIWALGVVFYELFTGSHPFDGRSVTEICASIFTKTPRSMREHVATLPAALDDAILRCLAREKEDRWPTAGALRAALAPFRSL